MHPAPPDRADPARSPTGVHRFSTALGLAGWSLAWGALNLAWLAADRLPRDGDEEGHVGAAELFLHDLLAGRPQDWLARLWWQDMGDYPSLYPAAVGGWWWLCGGGDPGRPAVRAVGLLWVLLTALAVKALADRAGPRAGALAFVAATLLPLPVGLARHFMPEGMLVAAVAVATLAAVRLAERPTALRGLALGLALGAGLLVKQTFPLLAAAPVLAALLAARPPARAWLGAAAGALLVAGPWTLSRLPAQLAYGRASAVATGEAPAWAHAAYYPVVLVLLVLGPPLALGLLAALPARRDGRRRLALVGAAWLLGGTLLLAAVPKKYPRLLAPVAPGAALLIGLAAAGGARDRAAAAGLVGAGAAWLILRSTSPPVLLPATLQDAVPGCPQHWLRPAVDDDLGLAAVARALAGAPAGAVRVVDAPAIPCALQTTPGWEQHLAPYLRRLGQDRDVVHEPGAPAAVELRWTTGAPPVGVGGGQVIAVPALGGWFSLHRT